ncbi:MAG: porin [Candidatus Accumulibacter sp.]|uniref:porin n=1 Tax=Accumulibacter sp. TaxID=2053492 RepID=UPI001AC14707|nr:porin [Accumulibacter sp.]MBN8438272.1 porin [Accumulibacter sp.]
MQKKLIALAVAGMASGFAAAQTNVTIYGVLDAGYLYSSGNPGPGIKGTNTFSGIANGLTAGNRLGFKGEEALGNGLKAVFTLEYGLEIDQNTGIAYARQQFVGLASNYGTVSLGRQYAPGFDATANNDALDATDLSIQSSLSYLAGNTITLNGPARFNNSIAYTSNNLSGFTLKGIYSFGESNLGNTYNNDINSLYYKSAFGLGVNYANGPVNVDAVYQSQLAAIDENAPPTAYKVPGTGKSINEWYVGGSWDFKVVKAFASYQALYNNNNVATADVNRTDLPTNLVISNIKSNNLWTVGLTAPIGRGTLGIGYGRLSLDNRNLKDGDSWGAGTMYTYPLSKRTALYAAYSYFSNDNYSIPGGAIAVPGNGVGALGESNYALGAGLRHSF